MEDWYKVSWKDFLEHNSLHLLSKPPTLHLQQPMQTATTASATNPTATGSSKAKTYSSVKVPPSIVVMSVFSEHNWLPWLFRNVTNSFWDSTENQRRFMKYPQG